MGSLAFYHAMAGVGKGWREAVIAKEDTRQKQMQREHDAALQKARLDAENERFRQQQSSADARHAEQMDLSRAQLESLDKHREGTLSLSERQLEGTEEYRSEQTEIAREELGIRREQFDSEKDYREALALAAEARAELDRASAAALEKTGGKTGSSKGYQQFVVEEDVVDEEGYATGASKTVIYSFDKDTNQLYRKSEGRGLIPVEKAEFLDKINSGEVQLSAAERALLEAPEKWQEYLSALKSRGMPAVLPPAYLAIHGAPEGYQTGTTSSTNTNPVR